MIVSDWRLLPAPGAAALYRREQARWSRNLSWDTSSTWHTVETARTTWGLPGLVCRGAGGAICGWTFYLPRPASLEIGGLVAETPAATVALVNALVERARVHGRLGGFIYAHAPGLDAALASRGLAARPFSYLVKALDEAPADNAPAHAACWTGERHAEAAHLLQRAYGTEGRLFAPGNTLEAWQEYVANLVRDSACGVLSPTLSRVVSRGDGYDALAIVTVISPGTAHLAQLAVDPSRHRQGLARQLLHDVLVAAAQEGHTRLSLLVAADNTAARALYRSLGFVEHERFVAIEPAR